MLKKILENNNIDAEIIEKVLSEMKEQKVYITGVENADIRYTKLKESKEALEVELKEANTTLTGLKESVGATEELKQKIANYETEITNIKQNNEKKIYDTLLNTTLENAGLNSIRATMAELDMEKIKYDEETGTLKGLKEQLEEFKETKSWMFSRSEQAKANDTVTNFKPRAGQTTSSDISALMKRDDFNLTDYLLNQKK